MATDLFAAVALIWVSGVVLIAGADHVRDLVRRHRLIATRRPRRAP
ncbi:MAG TPA: hypothetical protein VME40_06300 [Caulobacteraceae bacterium]|nr:hypothetical protein [Caulobacteraceae bacterium]